MPSLLIAFGTGYNLSKGSVEGPTTLSDHPLANKDAAAPGYSQGETVEALRPACASWIAIYIVLFNSPRTGLCYILTFCD